MKPRMNVARESRNQKNLTTKTRSHEDSHVQERGASLSSFCLCVFVVKTGCVRSQENAQNPFQKAKDFRVSSTVLQCPIV